MLGKLIPLGGGPLGEIVLDRLPLTLGRGDAATVCLPDRWVSRLHCEILEMGGELTVRDLGSKHGTMLNGAPVRVGRLRSGDRLTIGTQTFEVVCGASTDDTDCDAAGKTVDSLPARVAQAAPSE